MRMSEKEAAEYLGLNRQTLWFWRKTGKYRVPFRLIGIRAWYEKEDLDKYLEGKVFKPEGDKK